MTITSGSLATATWGQQIECYTGLDVTGAVCGWMPTPDYWVYVSATSFKVAGTNVRARYPVGTKLLFWDGGVAKYAYVIDTAFSTDTTVTIISATENGAAATLSGGVIGPSYYAYGNAYGFPPYIDISANYTGWSSYTTKEARLTIKDRTVFVWVNVQGTSNQTYARITGLPATNPTSSLYYFIGRAGDNGGVGVPTFNQVTGSPATVNFYKDFNYGTFTASGIKTIYAQFSYPI